VLAFGWSWVPKALAGLGVLNGVPVLPELGAFGPTVAAFVLVATANGVSGVRRLPARAVQVDYPVRWLAVALLLPVGVVAVALAVASVTGTVPSYPRAGTPIVLPIAFVFVFFLGGPVQEEFGWRGYLLDPLQNRLGATVAGLAIGLVWAVWHLPLCYIPSQTIYYNIPLFGFFVSTAFLSVLHTWLYNNTNRSLLPALLFHTAFNWANGMFPVLESDPASLTLLVMLAAAAVAVVAYWGPSTLSRPRSRSDATV
jgi:membrane protease YdiL (CAAX protease family)